MEEIEVDVLKIAGELLPTGEPGDSFSAADRDLELKEGDLIVINPHQEIVEIGSRPRHPFHSHPP